MSAWMNETGAPNHNGNGFHNLPDPSIAGSMMDPSAFMGSPAQFNPAQFPNQPQQQQQQHPPPPMTPMANGPMRNASPAYQPPAYQTNSLVPSKRPRPRDDALAGSPRQNPGMLPTTRSETPQQQGPFPGFQPGAMTQQSPNQPPYPHLQANGSANATPSPMMGNQQLRPGAVPQRVSTASPHPFSPNTQQQFGPQASPIPSEQNTPQPNAYMPNAAPNFNQNFNQASQPRPSPGPGAMMAGGQMMPQNMNPQNMNSQMAQQMAHQMHMNQQMGQQMGHVPHMSMNPQMQNQMFPPQMAHGQGVDQQKMYQMRAQQQQMQNAQGNGPPGQNMAQMPNMQQMMGRMQTMQGQGGRGASAKQPMGQAPNGQHMAQGGMRPQQRGVLRVDPEPFMKNLHSFMASKGLPLDPNPMIADRPVSLALLFQQVQMKLGYKNVTIANMWPQVASAMGFPVPQVPMAPQLLRSVYEQNLLKFEEVWSQRKMAQQQTMHAQGMPGGGQGLQQPGMKPSPQTPQAQAPPQMMQHQQPPHHATGGVPPGSAKSLAHNAGQQPGMNGFPGHHGAQGPPLPSPNQAGHSRNSLSHSVEPTSGHQGDFPMSSPVASKPVPAGMPHSGPGALSAHVPGSVAQGGPVDQQRPLTNSGEYMPNALSLQDTHGGTNLISASMLGVKLEMARPDIPPVAELGNIDIAALTRSLQSGLHSEVRLALETLASVTASQHQLHHIQLVYCEELVESLIECAEEQLDLLAEHTVEVSDEIQLTPYEDVVRACSVESYVVREQTVMGTWEYKLDRAVDRLLCITTILRNLSFPGEQNLNHNVLAEEMVIKFICVLIRYLGTRTMVLRTHTNTLDFMKDVVTMLSNIASAIEIPGREQAVCLLEFILSFAPSPGPAASGDDLFFTPYDANLHPYLPHAVDALAKLLARDEPNRTFYKVIFTTDAGGSHPYERLTRAFGLAVSPIPDYDQDVKRGPMPPLFEMRKPFLMQGLLAADILVSIAPGDDVGLVRTWLMSENALAPNIFRLVVRLSRMFDQPPGIPQPRGQPPRKDDSLLYIVVLGVTLLRRLAEKSRDPGQPYSALPPSALPSQDVILGALSMTSPEWSKEGVLQQLLAISNLST